MMSESPPLDRARFLQEIHEDPAFDVLIVGGGIAGVSTLRELSLEGLRCLLVERSDLANGASSALTRVAQGGFRYLEKGEIALVSRAVIERNRFVAAAPHQTRPLRVVLPSRTLFGGALTAALRALGLASGHSLPGAVWLRGAVALYEYLGRATRALPGGGFFRRSALQSRYAGINGEYRAAAYEFEALIASPERVAVEIAEDAVAAGSGSIALTHTRIIRVERDGVGLRDALNGADFEVKARVVVNAGGAGADAVARLFGVDTKLVDGVAGTHLLIRAPALAQTLGGDLLFFEDANPARDKTRLCCLYAVGDGVLLGATETPVADPDASRPSADEEAYLLAALRRLFPKVEVSAADIRGRLHGVRPLAAATGDDVTGRSRDHVIRVSPSTKLALPLISIAGGKWSTFRAIGADAADAALGALNVSRLVSTETLAIGGGRGWPATASERRRLRERLSALAPIDDALSDRLIAVYGGRAERVAPYLVDEAARRTIGSTDLTIGEVRFFLREELAINADDVVRRRTRLYIEGNADPAVFAQIESVLSEATAKIGEKPTVAAASRFA